MELLEFRPIREIVTIVRQKQYYCVIRLTKVLISMTQYYCNKSECLRGPFARMNSGPWNWKKNECVGNFRMISSEEIVSFLFTLLLFDSKALSRGYFPMSNAFPTLMQPKNWTSQESLCHVSVIKNCHKIPKN